MNLKLAIARRLPFLATIGVLVFFTLTNPAHSAGLQEAKQLFISGDYSNCIAAARLGLKEYSNDDDWTVLLCKALLETGRYPEALESMTNALAHNRYSMRLRWQAHEVFESNGHSDLAAKSLGEVIQMVSESPGDYRDAESLVHFGQATLIAGSDPKKVLDLLFETAKKVDPKCRDVYLASGGLALEKHDFALAAKRFQEGLKQIPDDPDLQFGLARAYAPSDPARMAAALDASLTLNSNHIGCLLLLAERCIDAEDYPGATELLDRVNSINPWHPDAWSYRAVLNHLQNQPDEEKSARDNALKFWPDNPRVDFLIGHKLSQNYRFTEGAAHQRQALAFDPGYLPALAQLSQDLLRLGREKEGWQLADLVQKRDGYDVEAYNLVTLHGSISKFATLTNSDFILRMNSREAALYGQRALELLGRAKTTLCAKYGMELKSPTLVEVFPNEKDFAVRTFGMPGNPGYLGVCFGTVITANSPASHPAHAVNWQAVLWHEFCHVVTLQKTRNKMPRWLSEGISVYEERQADPAWGEHMNPDYREMITNGKLTPVSRLSGAFLSPHSPMDLQFAYYESSLVVEFIVERFGLENLKAILTDLRNGLEINQAIATHTAPMEQLDKDFAAYARDRANKLAPGLDWSRPNRKNNRRRSDASDSASAPDNQISTNLVRVVPEESAATWASNHPTNFWVMTDKAAELIGNKDWAAAKTVLEKLVDLYPDSTGPDGALRMLAAAYRELDQTNAEHQILVKLAEKDDAAPDAYLRLMELDSAAANWNAVVLNANRYLAVDPLVAPPYRYLSSAAEKSGQPQSAIAAWRALIELDPPDPAEAHYQLARLLHQSGDSGARRQVLLALEDAPRYPAALRLLLDINAESPPGAGGSPAAKP